MEEVNDMPEMTPLTGKTTRCLNCGDDVDLIYAIEKNDDGECAYCFECCYIDHLERMEPQ